MPFFRNYSAVSLLGIWFVFYVLCYIEFKYFVCHAILYYSFINSVEIFRFSIKLNGVIGNHSEILWVSSVCYAMLLLRRTKLLWNTFPCSSR
jgi:hypothetical protein